MLRLIEEPRNPAIAPERLSSEMMALWKQTFHDSDEYISIIFDNYYAPENVEYCLCEDRVVAALLAVPYDFSIPRDLSGCADANEDRELHGLYLCGLATLPEYRRQGIMGVLINRILDRAKRSGFDFAFLIPASDDLRNYYRHFQFFDSFFKRYYIISSDYNFKTECQKIIKANFENIENIIDLKYKLFKSENIIEFGNINYSLYDEIVKFDNVKNVNYKSVKNVKRNIKRRLQEDCNINIISTYGSKKYLENLEKVYHQILQYLNVIPEPKTTVTIRHSDVDWQAVVQEFLLSDGEIVISENSNAEITGILFIQFIEEELPDADPDQTKHRKIVDIKFSFFTDMASKIQLLCFAQSLHSDAALRFVVPSSPGMENSFSYAMLRNLSDSDIPENPAPKQKNLKYSILANFTNNQLQTLENQNNSGCNLPPISEFLWKEVNFVPSSRYMGPDAYLLLE